MSAKSVIFSLHPGTFFLFIYSGYGLVSECIAHNRPILYVSRNAFEEEKLLRGALVEMGHPIAEVTLQDVTGVTPSLFDAARRVSVTAPYSGEPSPAAGGAEAVAQRLIDEAHAYAEQL